MPDFVKLEKDRAVQGRAEIRRVAAITGGASGIGFSFAKRWIADGGKAVLLDISADNITSAVSLLGGDQNARGILCDVTSTPSVDAAIMSISDVERRLDALLNGAGIGRPTPSHLITDEDFHGLLDIHLYGALRASRASYEMLKASKGSIVNISSVAAISGMPERVSYCTAKAGIEGLTSTLAVEWAADEIRVNAVAPGYTKTALTQKLIDEGKLHEGPIVARTPMRRFAEPEEIAGVIAFLFSSDASYVTGHALLVDGGMTIDGNWY
jgi:NAD(P)-dependent dehydrogenase (short-subunit alcohol dehydrogenase family)